MKHIVEFKDWTPEPAVNQLLQAEIDRIQRLVKGLRTNRAPGGSWSIGTSRARSIA